jgi:hypothetical protein
MTGADLLVDTFGRVRETVHYAALGLTAEQLAHRVEPEANSIAWLVWHLTRVQDDHIADAFDIDEIWTTQGWAKRFELPFAPGATGFGHSAEQVGAVRVESPDLLTGYYDAVHERTIEQVGHLSDSELERVVDTSWDPPVTLGVRLVSVISDALQHAGQAAFVRGIIEREAR